MRRFLLILTVLTFAGWSQPAQQQAQTPIVINNVPPHEGFWTGLLKLAIPTIAAAVLASGITLYGVNHCCPRQDRPVAGPAENTRLGGTPVGYLGGGLRFEISRPVQVIPKPG